MGWVILCLLFLLHCTSQVDVDVEKQFFPWLIMNRNVVLMEKQHVEVLFNHSGCILEEKTLLHF